MSDADLLSRPDDLHKGLINSRQQGRLPRASRRQAPYSRKEAWLDLVDLAAREPRQVFNRGRPVQLGVGQLIAPLSEMQARWNWSQKAVRHFFEMLTKYGRLVAIASEASNQARIVGIVDYHTAYADPLASASIFHENDRPMRRSVSQGTRQSVLRKTSGRCVYCAIALTTQRGLPNSFEVDHVLPVALGGTDDVANLVPSCMSCNSKKQAKTALVFISRGDQP